MSAIIEKATGLNILSLECKHCHQQIADPDTVAYHLVDGILYGWCLDCFGQRAPGSNNLPELPGATAVRDPVASAAA